MHVQRDEPPLRDLGAHEKGHGEVLWRCVRRTIETSRRTGSCAPMDLELPGKMGIILAEAWYSLKVAEMPLGREDSAI